MYLGSSGERTLFSVETINGRSISAHSHYDNQEEVMLLPGTRMTVKMQMNPSLDLYSIHLVQVIPDEILLEPPFEGARLFPHIKKQQKHRLDVSKCIMF
ncbi:unnamed protein product [Rotaria sordida]|uniref:Uncharacterized protein n=1 Tax=Rotaria sordida TaxID=392033 RepID=A0A815W1I6_9BILA|nr:unnamed protein product [Rotaria sordida]